MKGPAGRPGLAAIRRFALATGRRISYGLVALRGREQSGCRWPPDCLPEAPRSFRRYGVLPHNGRMQYRAPVPAGWRRAVSVELFRDDDQCYAAWLAANARGYVLNIQRSLNPSDARVHEAGCPRSPGRRPAAGPGPALTSRHARLRCRNWTPGRWRTPDRPSPDAAPADRYLRATTRMRRPRRSGPPNRHASADKLQAVVGAPDRPVLLSAADHGPEVCRKRIV